MASRLFWTMERPRQKKRGYIRSTESGLMFQEIATNSARLSEQKTAPTKNPTVRRVIMNWHLTLCHTSMMSKSMKLGRKTTVGMLTLFWTFGGQWVKILSISRPRPCICNFIRPLSIILTIRATMSKFNGSTLPSTKVPHGTQSSAICSMLRMAMLMATTL